MKKYYFLLGIGIIIIVGLIIYESSFLNQPFKEFLNNKSTSQSEEKEIFNSNLNEEIPQEISLIAVGDIMLSRVVGQKIKKYQDYNYPFLKTADLLKSADLTFGNLETAITEGREIQTGEMSFRADPEVTQGLNFAGFDILSLANNHSLNFGQKGIKDTFNYLNEVGIDYVGAADTEAQGREPLIKIVNGFKLAFLAYDDVAFTPVSYGSTSSRAGINFMDIEKMQADVALVDEKVDFTIVSMHSGIEYMFTPNNKQKEFAQKAIETGADLIIGHHPHVVQTAEKYQEGYIIYSLGNFVFDQMWSEETREGVVAEIIFKKEGLKEIKFYPVIIEDYSQPRFTSLIEGQHILDRLAVELDEQSFYYQEGEEQKEGVLGVIGFE